MCGIIGILDNKDAYKIAKAGLKLMNYRGLDGGRVVSFDNGALGHCLHAIVGSVVQPLGENNLFITNCEIYNWRQLMNDYLLQARNDAELFYCLLEKFGVEKTLELVDGDYACAYLIDNKIYLFRDIFGVKPLWYSNEDSFAFASEKKVLEDRKSVV